MLLFGTFDSNIHVMILTDVGCSFKAALLKYSVNSREQVMTHTIVINYCILHAKHYTYLEKLENLNKRKFQYKLSRVPVSPQIYTEDGENHMLNHQLKFTTVTMYKNL